METLESSRMCRLCGQLSGISIDIFDKNENHSKKINAVLPIMVHEMDLLPKQMCHRCSYKLEEFHKFYMGCLKTDAALKGQLSWMRKDRSKEKVGVPMVHIENVKIKTEPLDYDVYELEPLVENIDYINSMSSVAFPAGGIHDSLTYTAFSRCQCCCDKKDQSRPRRTTAKFFQDYEKRVSGCGGIADDSRKRSLEDTTTRLRPIKLKTMLSDCPESRLSHVDVTENVQDCLTTTASVKDDVSSLETRNHSEGRFEVIPEGQTASTSTVVRNLRPRKNLVYYPSNKKRIIHINPEPSAASNILDPKIEPVSDFEPMRQIKVEQVDEYEGRNLRPRRNVIDYQEPKMRRTAEHRAKKRKLDNTEHNSKLHAMDENALKFKIKQEALDDLNIPLDETISATPSSPKKFANIANLPAKLEVLTNDDKVKSRDDVTNYLKILLTKKKSLSNIVKNRLAKTKKINFSGVNYSPNRLRSQDTYLRNGKARNSDYAEWSAKRLQTRKLMDKLEAVNKDTKNMPVMLKLAESIKHYCETCNVSFMNKELLRLHTCYYD